MIVSWNWLKDYVSLAMDPAELAERLAMSGLNHESTESIEDDLAIDLEVTSNRADCLGHLGIAREIAVLWDLELRRPAAAPRASGAAASSLVQVDLQCPEICRRYTARVIRGVRVGPSPEWLVRRLATVYRAKNPDWKPVINVADITNYVLLECGQPLHAFDLQAVEQGRIIVRQARPEEQFEAIDHRTYQLSDAMCVIADPRGPLALGGVMGGAQSEVGQATRDLLIESADFAALPIRNAARQLNLHSDSSYRFERGVDPEGVEWASRRCCELILELAGGELAEGLVDVGQSQRPRPRIVLRLSQLKRVLGVEIPSQEVRRILGALGNRELNVGDGQIEFEAPSWRRDLTREIDLVEEVARIHGYDQIPEDVAVPMVPSHRTHADRVLASVREVLTAAGFDEAMTRSVVEESWNQLFTGWGDGSLLRCQPALIRGADCLRNSLLPSLLDVRRYNESQGNLRAELFETARGYLWQGPQQYAEPHLLGLVSGHDFRYVKGVVEKLIERLHGPGSWSVRPAESPLFAPGTGCQILLDSNTSLGFLGEVDPQAARRFKLRNRCVVAELSLDQLAKQAQLVRQYAPLSPFPAIGRAMNFVVDESLEWSELYAVVRHAGGQLVDTIDFQEVYRDADKDGPDKKRLIFNVTLRSPERTLTGEEADQVQQAIVETVARQLAGRLLG